MPELPDLEVYSKNLTKKLKGEKLKEIVVHYKDKINASEKALNDHFSGKSLNKVYRNGKQLFFDFGKEGLFSMHLMLHGKLVYQEDEAVPKFAIVTFDFSDVLLVLTDFQKIASITPDPKPLEGIDAFSDELTGAWLVDRLKKSKASIKAVLLDQKIIGGIGNAYADEILWEAKISPESVANKIPEKEVKTLVKAIKNVLSDAVASILKSDPEIISGEVRDFMKVHHTKKKESPGGKEILTAKIGGRTTYYTDEQILYK